MQKNKGSSCGRYINVESLWCKPETNIILCVNYTLINNTKSKMRYLNITYKYRELPKNEQLNSLYWKKTTSLFTLQTCLSSLLFVLAPTLFISLTHEIHIKVNEVGKKSHSEHLRRKMVRRFRLIHDEDQAHSVTALSAFILAYGKTSFIYFPQVNWIDLIPAQHLFP